MAISCIDASNVWKMFFEDKELYQRCLQVAASNSLHTSYFDTQTTPTPRDVHATYRLDVSQWQNMAEDSVQFSAIGSLIRSSFPSNDCGKIAPPAFCLWLPYSLFGKSAQTLAFSHDSPVSQVPEESTKLPPNPFPPSLRSAARSTLFNSFAGLQHLWHWQSTRTLPAWQARSTSLNL